MSSIFVPHLESSLPFQLLEFDVMSAIKPNRFIFCFYNLILEKSMKFYCLNTNYFGSGLLILGTVAILSMMPINSREDYVPERKE